MASKIEIPKKLVFFEGCTTSRLLKSLRVGTYAILEKAVDKGIIEEYKTIPNERCCGYPSLQMGDFETRTESVMFNINQLNRIGVKDVLFTCAACNKFLGDHPEFRRRGFRPINIMEFIYALAKNNQLDELVERRLPKDLKITGHYACHLRRLAGLRMEEMYPHIIEKLGATYVEMPNATDCCGAGSEGNVAVEIAKKKALNADKVDADVCPLACAGCEAILTVASKQAKVKARFTSLSALVVSCFNDLDGILKKLKG